MTVSRREFLRSGTVLALGAVAVACGKGGSSAPRQTAKRTFDQILAGRTQSVQVMAPPFEMLSRVEQRLVVGLFAVSDQRQLTGGTARAWVATSRTAEALGPFPLTFRGEGLGEGKGAYAGTVVFPADGIYNVLVETQPAGVTQTLVGAASVQIGEKSRMPKAGQKAISVPTPTKDRHRGVDPYCTAKPPCSMHEISLDRALANGKPTVLIIATPAFCESRLCGPEVELVGEVAARRAAEANFVHVEVFANDDADTIARKSPLSPAADAWHLHEEPAIYWIAADGTIEQRFVGPIDRTEVREQTDTLLA